MFTTILRRLGGITCGQVLAWSAALNMLLLTSIFIVVAAPDDGADVPAKAAQLQQMRGGAER